MAKKKKQYVACATPVIKTPEELLRQRIEIAVMVHLQGIGAASARLAAATHWAEGETASLVRAISSQGGGVSEARALAGQSIDAAVAIMERRAHREALKLLKPIAEAAGLVWNTMAPKLARNSQRQMTMDMDPKILDRVKKLLRLAEGTSNPNEAANAAAAAQKLIQEHNLGMVSLDDESVEYHQTRYADETIEQEDVRLPGSKLPRWETALLQGICRRHNARLLYISNRGGGHAYTILGAEKDRATIIYLFHYLRRQVEEVTIKAGRGMGRTFANNFRLGMVETISNRLYEMEQQTKTQAPAEAYARGGENAIVIVNESLAATDALAQRAEALMKEAHKGKKNHSFGSSRVDWSGREAGRQAGHRVNVAPGKALAR